MTRQDDHPLFEATLRIDNLPPEGRTLNVALSEDERTALAELLEISAVERLEASLDVTRFRGGIRALGRLHATIVQPCVVSFDPVTQQIDEPVDRVFLPEGQAKSGGTEILVDLEGEDDPDPLHGPEVDFSPLLTEVLALAIDPYPRAAGASLDELGLGSEGPDASPFAALKTLKDSNS
jgi:uncharacterized metal-binding protein YceD (DUF177 family)